jgi:DNA polymerase I
MNADGMLQLLEQPHFLPELRVCSYQFYLHSINVSRSLSTSLTISPEKSTIQTKGWILDLYPKDGCMIIWLKKEDGQVVRLIDEWQQYLYVSGSHADLVNLANQLCIERTSLEQKYINPEDDHTSTVLKVPVRNVCEAEWLAEKILIHGHHKLFELYNVDIKPSQLYMYEKNIFPFAYVEATKIRNTVKWKLCDDLESINYDIPPLDEVTLSVSVKKKGKLPSKTDPIETITIISRNESHTCSIKYDERKKLLWLIENLKKLNPDILYTSNGDSFLFPYLAQRAAVNGIEDQLILGREPFHLQTSFRHGQTYTSYGIVQYRPTPTRIPGRIHIDIENSMFYRDCGIQGIIEIARLCRIPLQRVTNTTIGCSMTSAQLHEANRQNVLIPWRKNKTEELKTANELIIADRGGFYYEPTVGLHESIGELDFTSLYPMIMLKKNLSGETVRCKCCPDSKNRVPELNYNICQKKIGIVPRSLKQLLKKRVQYKKLEQTTSDPDLKKVYRMRQTALKWILVCSFGYLGFKNARFGKIDAHIATCAFARQILQDAAHLAESKGFKLIHGIVDSLWLKKEDANEQDYRRLQAQIEETTGFPITFEGIYRWIVFLPSKTYKDIPALNRYYGVFENGKIKQRGIETRRHDTPPIIKQAILEMLNNFAKARNAEEFHERLPITYEIIKRYIHILKTGQTPIRKLVIRKRLSKKPKEYKHRVLQAIAASQLAKKDATPNPGESVSYIITNNKSKNPNSRILPLKLIESNHNYDAEAYVKLLLSAVETILKPFKFDKTLFQKRTKQTRLNLGLEM